MKLERELFTTIRQIESHIRVYGLHDSVRLDVLVDGYRKMRQFCLESGSEDDIKKYDEALSTITRQLNFMPILN